MWMWMPQPKLARQMGQAVTGSHGEKHPSQIQGVEELVGLAVTVTVHKVGEVEVAAVGHDGTVTDEVDQLGDHLLRLGSRGDIDIADAGELLDRARDSDFRANQRLEAGQDLIALEPNRADLDDPVKAGSQPRCLQIECDKRSIHRP